MTNVTLQGRVVIVTGPPGAGKTTVSRAIAETAGEPGGAHLHGDDFLGYIRKGFIPPHLPASRHQNATLSRALAAAACGYAGGGYLTLLDWVVGPWLLDVYRTEAVRTGVGLDYVVLRPSLERAAARSLARPHYPIVDYDHLGPLYHQLSRLGDFEPHALDTTELSPDETVSAVQAGLAAGRFRLL